MDRGFSGKAAEYVLEALFFGGVLITILIELGKYKELKSIQLFALPAKERWI